MIDYLRKNFLSIIGLISTIIFLVLLYFLLDDKILDVNKLTLAQIGAFFSGVFAPIAIIWLLLNYFQQNILTRLALEEIKRTESLVQPFFTFFLPDQILII